MRDTITDDHYSPLPSELREETGYLPRQQLDRRSNRHTPAFPLYLTSGETITLERRMQSERRGGAGA